MEKPVALNAAEIDVIVKACEENGVQFMDGTMWVHNLRTVKMHEFLSDSKRFGQLRALIEAITGGDAMTRLGVELESMGLDRMQVIRVAMYFVNKPNQLRIWNDLNDSYKPDFMKAILEE
ncbi:hypothetical protein Ddye_016488 [Dipteronia dyeriana]|uniref:Uncharacterized protein n=1 Tax=Dipteronia dyeriana TaxID=168575 RepID=A0AAD9U7B4_9ROSI|nr:hypothetical protein Ddye_016488 [Dipteronia dyeriana]